MVLVNVQEYCIEEVVMAIKTRQALFNADTRINTQEIHRVSQMVVNCAICQFSPIRLL